MRRPLATVSLALATAAAATALPAQTFRGYLQAGGVASQIDGDMLAGYNRLGFVAGAGVWYDLSDKWRASLTIAYAQNGSNDSAREAQRGTSGFSEIRLDYVAVPARLHYMDWLSPDAVYYRLEFVAGLEYRRLISGTVFNTVGQEIDFPLRDDGVGLDLGAFYSLSERSAIGAFHHWGILSAAAPSETGLLSKQFSLQWRQAF